MFIRCSIHFFNCERRRLSIKHTYSLVKWSKRKKNLMVTVGFRLHLPKSTSILENRQNSTENSTSKLTQRYLLYFSKWKYTFREYVQYISLYNRYISVPIFLFCYKKKTIIHVVLMKKHTHTQIACVCLKQWHK